MKEIRLNLTMLASGSRGNSLHVSNGETEFLIDAGCSCRSIISRMEEAGLSAEKLSAIVISHEHTDHIQGAGVLSRKLNLPIYGTAKSLEAASDKLKKIYKKEEISCGTPFKIGEISLHPFSIAHDAADPIGLSIYYKGVKAAFATDLGVGTGLVKEHLKNCRALIIEANHCPRMLAEGPYPQILKQRVKSRTGHLSNEETRDLLREVMHKDLKDIVIAHLSEKNNSPERALSVVGEALNGHKTRLHLASQDNFLNTISIKAD